MAGAAGLEPVTSAVTGQRSNQLSYAPAMGLVKLEDAPGTVKRVYKIRAADAKEVGVGNPAEETYCHPNGSLLLFCGLLSISYHAHSQAFGFTSLGFTPAIFFVKCPCPSPLAGIPFQLPGGAVPLNR